MADLTPDERALLREISWHIGPCIASTDRISDLSSTLYRGGFHATLGPSRITAEWHEWIPVQHREDGTPVRWERGKLLRKVRMSHERLRVWVESLPPATREQALIWYRTYPEDTRDLTALHRLTRETLDNGAGLTLFDLR